ncbi:MAG: magnesium/cobalt transporter CorA, partial [Candidatus Caldatribacteriota bacterium]|nr:magnesium/cobalt transporter CorA [Candidatus Caldatribacteriota bacterium]
KITVIDYDNKKIRERVEESIGEIVPRKNVQNVTWINLNSVKKIKIIEKIGENFNLHPLILEDIIDTKQRPKIKDFGDYLFIILKMFYCDKNDNKIKIEQVSLILGKNYVISFQEREGDVFDSIRERIRNDIGRIRKSGADYLIYTLIDAIVDNYFVTIEKLGEDIEKLEDKVISRPNPSNLRSVHKLKRNLIFLRKSVWPLREVINNLQVGETALIRKQTIPYLKDVYGHTIQVIDNVETLREIIAGILDIYLSSTSNKMNEIMKVLTIIATIFIPLTFITGIYGMNFRFMPEIKWIWGYPVALFVMLAIGAGMIIYFKKKKWM